jgi:hypothetical protein
MQNEVSWPHARRRRGLAIHVHGELRERLGRRADDRHVGDRHIGHIGNVGR